MKNKTITQLAELAKRKSERYSKLADKIQIRTTELLEIYKNTSEDNKRYALRHYDRSYRAASIARYMHYYFNIQYNSLKKGYYRIIRDSFQQVISNIWTYSPSTNRKIIGRQVNFLGVSYRVQNNINKMVNIVGDIIGVYEYYNRYFYYLKDTERSYSRMIKIRNKRLSKGG